MHSMQSRGSNGLESIGNVNNWGQENNYPTLNQCKAGFLEETGLNWALPLAYSLTHQRTGRELQTWEQHVTGS